MDITHHSDTFATCGQIWPQDLAGLKAQGFTAIVCARPDGEEEGQPRFAQIAAEADALGLKTAHVPVATTGRTEADQARFDAAMQTLEGRVLGYCRSGKRASVLWQALVGAE